MGVEVSEGHVMSHGTEHCCCCACRPFVHWVLFKLEWFFVLCCWLQFTYCLDLCCYHQTNRIKHYFLSLYLSLSQYPTSFLLCWNGKTIVILFQGWVKGNRCWSFSNIGWKSLFGLVFWGLFLFSYNLADVCVF